MRATLYKADGTEAEITPQNGKAFSLEELQKFVGGYIELCTLRDGRFLVLNEDGNALGLPTNAFVTVEAFHLMTAGRGIVGDCVICDATMVD